MFDELFNNLINFLKDKNTESGDLFVSVEEYDRDYFEPSERYGRTPILYVSMGGTGLDIANSKATMFSAGTNFNIYIFKTGCKSSREVQNLAMPVIDWIKDGSLNGYIPIGVEAVYYYASIGKMVKINVRANYLWK